MALIVRIDVDRPYGRYPLHRHLCSRMASDFGFPQVEKLGYLHELKVMLRWLNAAGARAYTFFRQCTFPSASVLELLADGQHECGLHLEDSRNFDTFQEEKGALERESGLAVRSMSKHGSGGRRYGRRHFAPYEPERYVEWAASSGITAFFGNLEDPTLPEQTSADVRYFPSAFWLEPHWRDTVAFPTSWLRVQAAQRNIVLLVHPENVLASAELSREFRRLINECESVILP